MIIKFKRIIYERVDNLIKLLFIFQISTTLQPFENLFDKVMQRDKKITVSGSWILSLEHKTNTRHKKTLEYMIGYYSNVIEKK